MSFKILRSGNPILDRVQQNIQDAFQALPVAVATTQAVNGDTRPADSVLVLLVTASLADVLVKVPKTRTAPLTVVHVAGTHVIKFSPEPENSDGKVSAGGTLTVMPVSGKLYAIGSFP